MTLQESDRKPSRINLIRLRNEPYLVINISLAAVIVFIMIYSAVFSPEKNNYPVVCVHEKVTGIKCASCGLSHSFSLIIRGRMDEASSWNENGIPVFLFFVVQFFMRAGFSLLFMIRPQKRVNLIIIDSSISAIMFIIAFMPFLIWMGKMAGS